MSVQSSSAGAKIVVLEVGRPIVEDIKSRIGEPTAVISYQRPIAEDEIPKIAGEVYRAVAKAASGGHEVHLVLSGPVGSVWGLAPGRQGV